MVYYFCHCVSLHVCPGENVYFGELFGHFLGGENWPFGFLLVVF